MSGFALKCRTYTKLTLLFYKNSMSGLDVGVAVVVQCTRKINPHKETGK